MSKKKTDTGKQSQQKSGKQAAGKPAAKSKSAPAKTPVKKTAPPKPAPPKPAAQKPKTAPQKQFEIVKPADGAAKPAWNTAGYAVVAIGAALLITGIIILGKIQYGKAGTGGFAAGVALVVIGIIIPCAGAPAIRELLFPRKTTEDLDITPAEKSGK